MELCYDRTTLESKCFDLQTSAVHCSKCDNQCPNGAPCVGGKCACRPGLTICGDFFPTCADLQTDRNNCGVCGLWVRMGACLAHPV